MTTTCSIAIIMAYLLMTTNNHRSFVDTASIPISQRESASEQQHEQQQQQQQDGDVQELEKLKHTLGETLEIMRQHSAVYANVNGHEKGLLDTKAEIKENGKLVASLGRHAEAEDDRGVVKGANAKNSKAKVRNEIEIPSEGVHKSFEREFPVQTDNNNGNRRSSPPGDNPIDNDNRANNYNSLSGVQYSPLDMAEYVFWTGDEKGVTLAIEEFLQQGLMSREEAISFLQEIKYNLDYLKNHYTQLGLNSGERLKENENGVPSAFKKLPYSKQKPEIGNNFDISQLRERMNKKSGYETAASPLFAKIREQNHNNNPQQQQKEEEQEEDYDEVLERLRTADFLYAEYSLEEVIYQLAKVMFTQSLTKGSAEAQKALQKFTNFLETEAAKEHISKALEKKVLDVLFASLSDTLNEHPELLANARQNSQITANQAGAGVQNFLRRVLDLNLDENNGGQRLIDEPKTINGIPLGIGKYKTL